MAILSKPLNWLHRKGGPGDTGGPRFRITSWTQGEAEFQPKGLATPITRPILRIYIVRLDRPSPVAYYDISSQILQAQLMGYLGAHAYQDLEFSVRVRGRKPRRQFGLNVAPLAA